MGLHVKGTPFILFLKNVLSTANTHGLGVVGTRQESYGEQLLVLNQQILQSAGRARTLYSPNAVNLITELKYI